MSKSFKANTKELRALVHQDEIRQEKSYLTVKDSNNNLTSGLVNAVNVSTESDTETPDPSGRPRLRSTVFSEENDESEFTKKTKEVVTDIMSYPPLITAHFNPDGNNRFRSKLQILIFVPSLIFILILFVVLIYPLFTQDTISTSM